MEEKKNNPVVSLVLGICGIVFSNPLSAFIGLILSIVGLVLSKKCDSEDKKTKAAKICSIIGLVLSIIGLIVGLIFIGLFGFTTVMAILSEM